MAKNETTFFMIKPDGMVNEIKIQEFLKSTGLDLAYSQTVKVSREKIFEHYAKPDEWLVKYGKRIFKARASTGGQDCLDAAALEIGKTIPESIADYMADKEMRGFIIVGEEAVDTLRNILGDTEPCSALQGTIRGKFSGDSFNQAWTHPDGPRAIRNVAHASDSQAEAYTEACRFFDQVIADRFFSDYLSEVAKQANDDLTRLPDTALNIS